MLLRHGGDIRWFSETYGHKESEVLDFSASINPLGIPDRVNEIYNSLRTDITSYPDPRAAEFCREVTRHFPIFYENVFAANGAMGVIKTALEILKPRKALLAEPCFGEYRRMLNLLGAETQSVLLREKDDFHFNLTEMISQLRNKDLLVIGQPNNPTGSALPKPELIELLKEAKRRDVFVIVDESFCDWNPGLSVSSEVNDGAYFMVVRSMTKFYALAGIRAGYGLASRRLVEKLHTYGETWAFNRLAQKMSLAALQDDEFRAQSMEWFHEEREWIEKTFGALEGFKLFPSQANFNLVKIQQTRQKTEAGSSAAGLFDFLARRGIYIRLLSDFTGLDAGYFRFCLRARKDNELLVSSVSEWMSQKQTFPYAAENVNHLNPAVPS